MSTTDSAPRPAVSVVAGPAPRELPGLVARRLTGRYDLDEWGLDRDLISVVAPLGGLRWRIDVVSSDAKRAVLPPEGPALVLHNQGLGVSEPLVVASGLRREGDRIVRFASAPDVAPLGPALRRLGGVSPQPAEVRGLLRAGEVVAVGLVRGGLRSDRAGEVPLEVLAEAVAARVPVVPVGVRGHELGRRWVLRVGEPMRSEQRIRGVTSTTPPPEQAPAGSGHLERFAWRIRARVDELLAER